jgi:hypothetical protein
MTLGSDPTNWRRSGQFGHRVQIPATANLTRSMGILHAWAIRRCGRNGYAQTTQPHRAEPDGSVEFVMFHFETTENATEFAAAWVNTGAKLV